METVSSSRGSYSVWPPVHESSDVRLWSYRQESAAGRSTTMRRTRKRILEGQGRVRIGDCDVSVRAGDYVALLSGPDGAHQTFNDSTAVLRYLCISTMIEPEVNFYPESSRVGFFAGSAPGSDREQRFLEGFVSLDACQDYWAGEKVDDDSV